MSNAYRDENSVPTLIASSNTDGQTPVRLYADPVTHRLLVDATGTSTGLRIEDPTGTVDGVNTDFTVTHTPQAVWADGMVRLETFDYTYSAGTITMFIPPSIWIRSIY